MEPEAQLHIYGTCGIGRGVAREWGRLQSSLFDDPTAG
jgi:hypothetical protein